MGDLAETCGVHLVIDVPLALSGPEIARLFLNGISRGMIIFLTASGLTLIFGLVGLINFTHGTLFTLAGYITVSTVNQTGSYWLGLALGIVVVCVLGLILERSMLNRLYEEPLLGFLATFGIGPLILREILRTIYGGQTYGVPNPIPGSFAVGPISYPNYRLFIIFAGGVVAILIGALLKRTRFGMEIYATTVDTETAEFLGTNTKWIFTATFVLGVGLAALAGGLMAPITGVNPELGLGFMLIAFLVIILGGMGSFKGSFVASILAGIIISFGSAYIRPTYASMAVFFLAMVVILFKPTGFFGREKVLE